MQGCRVAMLGAGSDASGDMLAMFGPQAKPARVPKRPESEHWLIDPVSPTRHSAHTLVWCRTSTSAQQSAHSVLGAFPLQAIALGVSKGQFWVQGDAGDWGSGCGVDGFEA